MTLQETTQEVWRLTKPSNPRVASKYLGILAAVLQTSKKERFWKPFFVKKKSGGTRRIVPANEPLVFVQSILADWILRTFPKSADYCYSGNGVLNAVKTHQGAKAALVVDLKSAFDQITAQKLRFALTRHLLNAPPDVISVIIDLATYDGTTPQGCVSTPYFYNIVVEPIDRGLLLLRHENPNIYAVSRYSDNICVSVRKGENLKQLEKRVKAIIEGNGFELSWVRHYDQEPFEFLGTQIFTDKLWLAPNKDAELYQRIVEATQSPTPQIYYNEMMGVFNWIHHISEGESQDLLETLRRYFATIHKVPKGLTDLQAQAHTKRLF